ncbi:MAG: GNAT family N-acetyltransferase [Chloroflexi bacterium]|nr:GNAT family N-acetyltransferase [Chloroflexota bacterium]
MQIVDLSPEHEQLYFVCLEDWSEEVKEAGNHKEVWYGKMKDKGLRVKLALDDGGRVGGMIQYVPIEHSFAEGNGLYFIDCIWVHGHKQGRGDFQKKGMGKALLEAAENDAKDLGAKGIAAWGIILPFWMKAAWFKKHGYRTADRQGIQALLWKPFASDAMPPKWVRQRKKPQTVDGQVAVTAFSNGWCPAQNIVLERARRASAEFGDKVIFRKIDTFDRGTFLEWGIADALFIGDRQVRTGPPPSYEKIRKLIGRKVARL